MDGDVGLTSPLVIVTSSSSSLRARSSLRSVIGDSGLCCFLRGGVVDVDDVVEDEVVLESESELEILVDELLLLGMVSFESNSVSLFMRGGVDDVRNCSGDVGFFGGVLDVGFVLLVLFLGFILIKVSGCCMRGRLRTVGSSSGISSGISSGVLDVDVDGVGESLLVLFVGVVLACNIFRRCADVTILNVKVLATCSWSDEGVLFLFLVLFLVLLLVWAF